LHYVPSGNDQSSCASKNAGDQISMNLHGPDVFPHLQAGAVRRPLSSKPKPGESKKVPKFRDDFRYFTRRPRELAGLTLPRVV